MRFPIWKTIWRRFYWNKALSKDNDFIKIKPFIYAIISLILLQTVWVVLAASMIFQRYWLTVIQNATTLSKSLKEDFTIFLAWLFRTRLVQSIYAAFMIQRRCTYYSIWSFTIIQIFAFFVSWKKSSIRTPPFIHSPLATWYYRTTHTNVFLIRNATSENKKRMSQQTRKNFENRIPLCTHIQNT